MRLYPNFLPAIEDEPQPSDFVVEQIDDQRGQGVIALRAFAPGDVLFRMNGIPMTEITQHTLQLAPEVHLHDPWVAGKVLHSCAPNSRLDVETQYYVAVRPIAPGDLLTMDYDETEDVLYRAFECRCGAPQCRGFIAGRKVPVAATQDALT